MGSKFDGPSGPRSRFFIVGLSHFQRGIGPYTWLACKTDISEEVRNHRSDVISWLFVVPRLHTHKFSATLFIVLMLRALIKTVTNRAALNWYRAPKRTHRQTQATTIPVGQTGLGQKSVKNFVMVYICSLKYFRFVNHFQNHSVHLDQGAVSIRKTVLPGMAIPMLKIRRPNGRLIFNMEIAICR